MGNPATGQQLNYFRSDARGAIDRSQTELKSSFWNVLSTPVDYVYAVDQRLAQINSGSSLLAGYAYDAFGRRVGKTRPGKPLHTFAYAGSQLLAENAGTPSHYAYLDGQALARIDGSAANSPIYYFHNHPLGVPLKASNAAGQTVWAAQLQPFGLMQTTTNAISQNLRFPGQYFDAESGLHYNMARYYSPELGRYLQSDPIGLAGGINTYAYVRNNPVNLIDPEGLEDSGLNQICAPNGQGTTCTTGMRPPPEGTPINGPLSPVGIAATAAEAGLAACPVGRGVGLSKSSDRLLWGSWKDYQKISANGREYAQVGDRLYTRHAVDRMQPGGLGTPAGGDGPGRSFSPNLIDEVISNGLSRSVTVNGVERTIYSSGTAEVVTEQGGRIVITVNPFRGGQ
ncbi:RHS repeat-associated core domain-containing protein [Methylomonas koyamae]|uniref:RHS repeat-associated core domain-containing protein n=1 Tax=Methylomonas koyamae TaxID=702114 RepID=UPI002872B19F|nr:RHS repeat-associated core domain-containing protein [Methylomonas koyamae]WNB75569.1 RHS repeat-associated core domain-containing protein [Methylomonas koyamae]